MAKYVSAPIAGASISNDVVVVTLSSFVGGTDMSYSIAMDVRKSGRRVALLTMTDPSYIEDWVDDDEPEIIVYDGCTTDYAGKTVIVISNDALALEQLQYEGASMVVGIVSSNVVMNMDAFRLEQSDRMLLNELEKLLPADSPVRVLRDELRRRVAS